MAIYAIIENGSVINTIVAEPIFIAEHFPGAIDITGQPVGIGWTYDGAAFSPPPQPEPLA